MTPSTPYLIPSQELEADLKETSMERMRLALHHEPSGANKNNARAGPKETAARLSEILTIQKELEVRTIKGNGFMWHFCRGLLRSFEDTFDDLISAH